MRVVFAAQATEPGWPRLLADIGGTNARMGWQTHLHGPIEHILVLPCTQYEGPAHIIQAYLKQQNLPQPDCAALGMAVPVAADEIQMTNLNWRFSIEQVRAQLGLSTLMVINDFTALALAIPDLPLSQLRPIGSAQSKASGPIALLGPGTGLGVSGLLPVTGTSSWVPLAGEGGHVTLSASNRLEYEVIETLRQRHGHVSAERVLCGKGVIDLYTALAQVQGVSAAAVDNPAQVLQWAQQSDQALALQTIQMFCAWLATVAGDLALTLGATGGVYIGGGIMPRLGSLFDATAFRTRFEDKGRFRSYLQGIPTWLIDTPVSPALFGAARALNSTTRHHS